MPDTWTRWVVTEFFCLSLLIKPLICNSWGCNSELLPLHAKLFRPQCSSWEICVSFHLLHCCIRDLISDTIVDQPGFKNHYYLLQYIDHLSLENRSYVRCLTPSLQDCEFLRKFLSLVIWAGPCPPFPAFSRETGCCCLTQHSLYPSGTAAI